MSIDLEEVLDPRTLRFTDGREMAYVQHKHQQLKVHFFRGSLMFVGVMCSLLAYSAIFGWSSSGGVFLMAEQMPAVLVAARQRNLILISMVLASIASTLMSLTKIASASPRCFELTVAAVTLVLPPVNVLLHPWYQAKLSGLDPLLVVHETNHNDSDLMLWLDMMLTAIHLMLPVRWIVLWPFEVLSILAYVIPALTVGSKLSTPTVCLRTVLLFSLILAASLGKRALEYCDRAAFAQVAAERTLRVIAERNLDKRERKAKHNQSSEHIEEEQPLPHSEPASVYPEHGPQREAPPSQFSAPAVLCRAPAANASQPQSDVTEHLQGCEGVDCLPPTALVWLEGETLPKPLGDISPGQNIMCFDRLSGHVKHAAVVQASLETGPVTWAKVSLEDGTVLDMTADHPVQPAHAATGHAKSASLYGPQALTVCAQDLQPEIDHLLVLKTTAVRVKGVEIFPRDSPRVYLAVQQPERHSIFVATPQGGVTDAVAIAPANLQTEPTPNLGVKGTFLHLGSNRPEARRSVSAPPSLMGGSDTSHHVQPNSSSTNTSRASALSRSSNSSSISNGESQVVVAGALAPRWEGQRVIGVQLSGRRDVLRLGDILGTRAAGQPSLGSFRHEQADCDACFFENRRVHQGGIPCYKGTLCDRCHKDHGDFKDWKRDRRRQLTRRGPSASTAGRVPL